MIIQRTAIIRLLLIMAISINLYVSESYAASGSAAYESIITEMPWNVKKVSSEVCQQSIDSKGNLDTKHTTEKYKKDFSDDRSAVERYQKEQKTIEARNGRIVPSLESIAADTIAKSFIHNFQQEKTYEDRIHYLKEARELLQFPESIQSNIWFNNIAPHLGLHKQIPLISNEQYRLECHGTFLHSVFWSPDGNKVATASRDNTAKIWDASNGQLLHTLQGHGSFLYSVSWSPDGSKVATASWDCTAKIWNANNGQLLHTLRGHRGWVCSVCWSPDGSRVATASRDCTAKIWNVNNGQLLHTLRGHRDWVRSVSWSPDGSKVATASEDCTAKIWNVSNGQLLHTLQGHRGWVCSVSWSPDGSKVATASEDCTAKIWNVSNGQLLHTLQGHRSWVCSVSWSPDGNKVVTGSDDHTTKIWNANNGKLLHTLQSHKDRISSVSWSPDGSKVATASWDHTAKIWNANDGQLLQTLQGHEDVVRSVSWSPDGSKVATASWDYTTKIWNVDFLNEKTYKDFCDGKLTREQCTFLIWLSDKRAHSNRQLTLSSELHQTFKTFHPVVQESIKKHYKIAITAPHSIYNHIVVGILGLAAIGIGYGLYKWIKG